MRSGDGEACADHDVRTMLAAKAGEVRHRAVKREAEEDWAKKIFAISYRTPPRLLSAFLCVSPARADARGGDGSVRLELAPLRCEARIGGHFSLDYPGMVRCLP
jgi:hypothetical protein